MDEDLKTYLDLHFGQIDQRFAQIDQRFGQIDQRFGQIDQRFAQIDQRFVKVDRRFESMEQQMQAMREDLTEKIHDTETRLLSEFWKWARTSDQRVRHCEQIDAHMAERLAVIDERIFALERKVMGSKE